MDAKLNQLPKIADFDTAYILVQQAHEDGFRGSTFAELYSWLQQKLDLTGLSNTAGLPDPLPQPGSRLSAENANEWTILAPGTYNKVTTGTIEVSENEFAFAQFDGVDFNIVQKVELPDNKIEDWELKSYAKGAQVFYDGNIYQSLSETLMNDIPEDSAKWLLKTDRVRLDVVGGAASYNSIINNGVDGEYYEAGFYDFLIDVKATAGGSVNDSGWRSSKKQSVKKGQKVIVGLYGNSASDPAILFTRNTGAPTILFFGADASGRYNNTVDVPFDGEVQVNTFAIAPRDAFIKITTGSIFITEQDVDSGSQKSVLSTQTYIENESKWKVPSKLKNVYYDLTWEQGRIVQQGNKVAKSVSGEALSWRTSSFLKVNKGDVLKINLKGHITGAAIAISLFSEENINSFRNNLLLYTMDLIKPNEFWGEATGQEKYPKQMGAQVIVPVDGYVAFNTHLAAGESNEGQGIFVVDAWQTESPQSLHKSLEKKNTKEVPSSREVFVHRPSFMRLDLFSLLPNQQGRNIVTGELSFSENGIEFLRVVADTNIQGHASAAYPKKGYNFDFWNNAEKGLKVTFGDWVTADTYHLKAHQTDRTHSRDVASGRWWRDMVRLNDYPASEVTNRPYSANQSDNDNTLYTSDAIYHTDGVPCELYVHNSELIGDSGVYGEAHFMGLYTFRLKKRRENYSLNRDNMNHIFLDSSTMQAYMGRPFNPANWDLKSPRMSGYEEAGPIPDPEVQAKCERLFDWLSNIPTRSVEHADFIILPLWIDYLIFMEIIGHWDANGNNTNLQTWDGQTWAITPYDMDNTMGLDPRTGGQGNFKFSVTQTGELINFDIWAKFKAAYLQEIKARYNYLRDSGFLTTANIFKYYKDLTAPIPRNVYWRDKEKWNSLFATIPTIQQIGMYLQERIRSMDNVWRD